MNKSIPECSAEAVRLYQRISKMEEGDVITYAELSQIVSGEDVQTKRRYWLETAMRRALADGVVCGTIRGEGITRLHNSEIEQAVGSQFEGTIRRKAKRTIRKLKAVDYSQLTGDQQTSLSLRMAQAGMVQMVTSTSSMKTLKGAEAGSFDPKDTLKLFG